MAEMIEVLTWAVAALIVLCAIGLGLVVYALSIMKTFFECISPYDEEERWQKKKYW